QLMLTTEVENYPGHKNGILGPELMTTMREQAERFGAEIMDHNALRVDFNQRPFKVWGGHHIHGPSTDHVHVAHEHDGKKTHHESAEEALHEDVDLAEAVLITTGAE